MGGDTDFGFSSLPQAVALVRGGQLRGLAVSSPARMPALPEVPTVAEQGFAGFERAETSSFWAPAGTPAAAIARLNQAMRAALAEPEVRAGLERLGMSPVGSSPAELAASSAAYRAFAEELIRSEGIKPD